MLYYCLRIPICNFLSKCLFYSKFRTCLNNSFNRICGLYWRADFNTAATVHVWKFGSKMIWSLILGWKKSDSDLELLVESCKFYFCFLCSLLCTTIARKMRALQPGRQLNLIVICLSVNLSNLYVNVKSSISDFTVSFFF